ncbi:MAG: hypothetical protein EPO11_02385 [Gammaproteobacteria bacterium]|nr:MAG: hypothetical protein EPO11_02385 [Gammaproteobacteria bacterium]
MMIQKKRHIGMTLVEIMLVLSIATLLVIWSFRQYQTYRLDADVRRVKYNVDMIMESMYYYYRANCLGRVNPTTGILVPGTLNPSNTTTNPLSSSTFPINILTDLFTPGYLPANIPAFVPLVDSSAANSYGYVAQFNLVTSTRSLCTSANCATSAPAGTVVDWNIQVAVSMKDKTASSEQGYLQLLQGNCLSSLNGWIVTPCTGGTGSGEYVVFERSPSRVAERLKSNFQMYLPAIQQFNNMYSTYNDIHLLSTGGKVPGSGGVGTTQQYFLCNS